MGGPEQLSVLDEVLSHYGVKGMRWGQRKSETSAPKDRGKIRRGITKASTALDASSKVVREGNDKLIFLPQEKRQQIAKRVSGRALGEAAVVNSDPKFKGKDLKRDAALKKAYYEEIRTRMVDAYKEELTTARVEFAADLFNTAISSSSMTISTNPASPEAFRQRGNPAAPDRLMRHSDEDEFVLLSLKFEHDELGHISGVELVEDDLAHYGVKGMRWGHRKDRSPVDVQTSAEPGKRVQATGGQNQPAHDDARRSASFKQQAKQSTTDSLSTKELQELVNRMNLERQYANLTATDSAYKRAKNTVKELLGLGKTYNEVVQFTNSPAGKQMKEQFAKKAA